MATRRRPRSMKPSGPLLSSMRCSRKHLHPPHLSSTRPIATRSFWSRVRSRTGSPCVVQRGRPRGGRRRWQAAIPATSLRWIGPPARAVPAGPMVHGVVGTPGAAARAADLGPVCTGRLPGVSRADALHPGAAPGTTYRLATPRAVRGGASSAGVDRQCRGHTTVSTASRGRRNALAGQPGLWVAVRQVAGAQANTRTTGRDGRRYECGSTRGMA
jgi:hypothetical protein